MPTLRVPLSWLREYVDVPIGPNELAERLHLAGNEVDRVERRGAWEHVWVGRIAAIDAHPNADKLVLATVDYGEGRRKTVVTGATNLTVGAIVPYAEIGAVLQNAYGEGTITLVPKPLRGVISEGMVCSAKELGLGEDHEGILILDPSLPVGAALADVFGETIIQLEIAPNRPDALSVVGIAREAAALLRLELRDPERDGLEGALDAKQLSVRIEDPEACPRFAAAYLEGVRIAPSPAWMQERLAAAGMRSINNVVDITNYVMLELGQPLHAYDAERLQGRALVARKARPDERLITLDEIDRELRPDDLVIADEARGLGLAGIMGGVDSGISDGTTVVALECASFEPRGIRRSADAHELSGSNGSQAGRRFALGLSPEVVPVALARAVWLLREHAEAKLAGTVDLYPTPRHAPTVRLRVADFSRVLGMEVAADEAVDALRRLGFATRVSGETLEATPPATRMDIAIAEDVVEEVARAIGYERIPTRIPSGPLPLHEAHPLEAVRERVRDMFASFGLDEIVTYPLIDPEWLTQLTHDGQPIAPEPLRVQNPTSVAASVLRPTLRASLLDAARRNIRNRDSVALFEIAPVYLPREGDLPEERWIIGVVLAGKATAKTWADGPRDWDFFDLKGMLITMRDRLPMAGHGEKKPASPGMHPGYSETFNKGDRVRTVTGKIDPRVAERWELPESTFVAEIDLALIASVVHRPQAVMPSRFPAALRDLSLVVDESITYGQVAQEVSAAAKGVVESVSLLDIYRGPQIDAGKKSFALRLVLRSAEGTLAEADVDKAMKRVEGRVKHQLGATVRG